jgi:hypothetical protein
MIDIVRDIIAAVNYLSGTAFPRRNATGYVHDSERKDFLQS